MRPTPVLLALLTAGPAFAGDPIVLYLENRASRGIEQLVIFPVNDAGEVVDDVLMARHEPIAGHETVALDTRLTKCGVVSVWAKFFDGEEISARTDLCRNNRLVAHD